jgi:hypothetical protein
MTPRPTTARPRWNVDVRWVNRANMAVPLTHPANAAWLAGFAAWQAATAGGHG